MSRCPFHEREREKERERERALFHKRVDNGHCPHSSSAAGKRKQSDAAGIGNSSSALLLLLFSSTAAGATTCSANSVCVSQSFSRGQQQPARKHAGGKMKIES
jgi:hypothetical protein